LKQGLMGEHKKGTRLRELTAKFKQTERTKRKSRSPRGLKGQAEEPIKKDGQKGVGEMEEQGGR